MPTAFRQTAIAADDTGKFRTSIILASRIYGEWSENAIKEHCEREGRTLPIKALTLTDAEADALEADSSLRLGYVDKAGDVDSPFQPAKWRSIYDHDWNEWRYANKRVAVALYECEEGSDDPRAIQGGGGASEKFLKVIRGTRQRIDAYCKAYFNRYGDELLVRHRP